VILGPEAMARRGTGRRGASQNAANRYAITHDRVHPDMPHEVTVIKRAPLSDLPALQGHQHRQLSEPACVTPSLVITTSGHSTQSGHKVNFVRSIKWPPCSFGAAEKLTTKE
jgi:hypothetical protein